MLLALFITPFYVIAFAARGIQLRKRYKSAYGREGAGIYSQGTVHDSIMLIKHLQFRSVCSFCNSILMLYPACLLYIG